MTIGERVAERRHKKQWSQVDLARESGVPQATISRLEQGKRPAPGPELLRKLAVALGVSVDWLIGMYEADVGNVTKREEN